MIAEKTLVLISGGKFIILMPTFPDLGIVIPNPKSLRITKIEISQWGHWLRTGGAIADGLDQTRPAGKPVRGEREGSPQRPAGAKATRERGPGTD